MKFHENPSSGSSFFFLLLFSLRTRLKTAISFSTTLGFKFQPLAQDSFFLIYSRSFKCIHDERKLAVYDKPRVFKMRSLALKCYTRSNHMTPTNCNIPNLMLGNGKRSKAVTHSRVYLDCRRHDATFCFTQE